MSEIASALPTGIIQDEPIALYHASDSAGHTKLEVLRDPDRGPLRYFMQYIAKTLPPPAAKNHFDVGSAFDSLLLEGEKAFAERVAVLPDDYNGRTNVGKALLADLRASGKIVLDSDERNLVLAMQSAVARNADAVALLSAGKAQLTFRAAFKSFTVQTRPDWWNNEGVELPSGGDPVGPYMVDVKTAEDLDRFLRNRIDFGYDRQAALYREIARIVLADIGQIHVQDVLPPDFFFVVVFKTAPVDCVVFKLSDEDAGTAGDEVMNDLLLLKRCYDSGVWPGSPRGVHTLPRPSKWKAKDIF